MKIPQPLFDYFLFTIDKRFEDDVTENGIILLNTAYFAGGEYE